MVVDQSSRFLAIQSQVVLASHRACQGRALSCHSECIQGCVCTLVSGCNSDLLDLFR